MSAFYAPIESNAYPGWPQGPAIEGAAAISIDASTHAVLYYKNADAKMYPASITKIMTGLLACEHLNMKDTYAISEAAAYGIEPGSSSIYADTGELLTVEQEMAALMLESANEIALALAEQTSGSVKKFVELMNQRARELGCTNTHFNNPNGLHDENHYTTASDMAKIAIAAWNNPLFRKFVTTDIYEIPPTNVQKETRYLRNHHGMMKNHDYPYDGVLGGKTGYTMAAGNTLVTYASKNNLGVVTVVMNSIGGAYSDTASILDYSFQNFQRISLGYRYDPVPSGLLPYQIYSYKTGSSKTLFHARRSYYATVPLNVPAGQLKKETTLQRLASGPYLLKDSYYYNDIFVGYGKQYSRKSLAYYLPTISFL
ncbi:MAG: D-alanyl-D-alanine carboxypeptidase [Blautia sp.]|nr:D-alanyl-D-alanine carboxypeptidase [Blautia sp.]